MLRIIRPFIVSFSMAFAAFVAASVDAQTPLPNFQVQVWGEMVTDFTARIDRYAELRGELERGLPMLAVTEDPHEIHRRQRLLANAIRRARPDAVRGDVFTQPTSAQLQLVLAATMDADIWKAIMDENPGEYRRDADAAYPEGRTFATTPALVLRRLPQLPDDIQYRFLGRDLILYDVRANTIIDQLPNAIGRKEGPGRQ